MLPKVYYLDKDVFRHRIGKRIYKLKRLLLILLIVTIRASIECVIFKKVNILVVPSIIFNAILCCIAVLFFYFMVCSLKEKNLCCKYKDITMLIDKDIPLFIMPCEKNDELVDIYQCNSIDNIEFKDNVIVISGKVERSSLNLNSIKAENESLTEIKIYRIFSENAEKELISYIERK